MPDTRKEDGFLVAQISNIAGWCQFFTDRQQAEAKAEEMLSGNIQTIVIPITRFTNDKIEQQ